MDSDAAVIVWTSLPDESRAGEIAVALVQESLAACVHIFPMGRSYYIWEGALNMEGEWAVMIKTRHGQYAALEQRLRELHPYQTPEILATPVVAGSADYLAWLKTATRPD